MEPQASHWSIRPFTTADIPALVEIFNQSAAASGEEAWTTLEDLTRQYRYAQDLTNTCIVGMRNATPVAYGRIKHRIEPDGTHIFYHFLRSIPGQLDAPQLRAILELQHQRIDAIAQAEPALSAAMLQTELGCRPDPRYQALLVERGYAPIRTTCAMTRDLARPVEAVSLPEGLEVRSVQSEQIRPVWDAHHEALRDHWGFSEPTEASFESWLHGPMCRPELWQVAWDGPQIAGMVLNYVDQEFNRQFQRQRGYTEGISVRRPWRRRRLSAALLARSMTMFQAMGMTEAALSVDEENPHGALRIYQRAGFVEQSRTVRYQRPLRG